MQFYPGDHPRVTEHISNLLEEIQQFLADSRQFVVGVDNQRLLIQDAPIEDSDLSDQLVDTLEKRKIGSVIMKRGVTDEEVRSFLELLTLSPEELLEDEDIKDEYLAPFQHIEIDELEVQYSTSSQSSAIDAQETTETRERSEEADTESDREGEEDDAIFSDFEDRSEALQELLTAEPEPEMIYEWVNELTDELDIDEDSNPAETGFEAIMKLINKTVERAKAEGMDLPDDPAREFLVQFLIKIGLMGDESFSSVKDKLASCMDQLEGDAHELLLGETDPNKNPADDLLDRAKPKARGLVIAREIRNGTASRDQLSQMMESVAPGGNDVVEVTASAVEEMSQFTRMSEEKSSASELSSLFNALLANTPYQDPSHQILIADDDVEYDQYLIYLSNLNYFFDLYEDGYEAWRAITSDKSYDLLILEIKISGKTGLELIEDIATLDNQPPIIVCTKYPQFRDAYEIVTYPEIEFLEKPVQEEEFNDAVRNLFPSSEEDETDLPSLYSEEEIERARDIQHKLMSQPLPELERYELSRFHEPSPDIDGDYLDVIPINEDEYLIAMAEVSGKGVSASLVMVIIRSTLHVLLKQIQEPREMLVQLNRFISNEINRPMFANVVLGRFDTSKNTIQFASAGKTTPLFWNQKAKNVSTIDLTGISVGLTGDRRFDEYLETRSIALNPGDAIVLHTSGIPDLKSEDGNHTFGTDRIHTIVQQNASDSAQKIYEQLQEQIASFSGGDTLSTDCSALMIKSS